MDGERSDGVALEFSRMGLFVIDIARMAAFYRDVLGFPITARGKLGEADLAFFSRDPRDRHQIVLMSRRPPELPDRIVNQVSFRVASLAELKRFHRRVRDAKVDDLAPICHGSAWSVYFRDPEGNRRTEEFCRARPGFKRIEEWRAEVVRKIAMVSESRPT
jgi:catechol 2,3-dioxygenase